MEQTNAGPPSTTSRILALGLCPLYLFVVATGFSSATEASLAVTLPAVLAGAAAITSVLVAFGVKAYRHNSRKLRFNLGTVLLFVVPVCIYLTAFQQILRAIPLPDRELPLLFALAAFGVVFAGLTTIMLLYFAEAVLWLALGILRWRLRSGRDR